PSDRGDNNNVGWLQKRFQAVCLFRGHGLTSSLSAMAKTSCRILCHRVGIVKWRICSTVLLFGLPAPEGFAAPTSAGAIRPEWHWTRGRPRGWIPVVHRPSLAQRDACQSASPRLVRGDPCRGSHVPLSGRAPVVPSQCCPVPRPVRRADSPM